MIRLALLIPLFNLLFSIAPNENALPGSSRFPYRPNQPDFRVSLPDVLTEVSGIAWIDPTTLACIQDENGTIYTYDLNRKTIIKSYTFGEPGDFEGITMAGDVMYILRSDGIIYEINNFRSAGMAENEYTLRISSPNCEGICYDKSNNRLLIASKGKSADKDEKEARDLRFVYAFDLQTKTMNPKPFMSVNLNEVEAFARSKGISLPEKKSKDGEVREAHLRLRSSEIAIHPLTRDIYILSAAEYLLYVFSPAGRISDIIPLDKELYPKAEGLTFSPEGNMYITNEGDKEAPTLLFIRKI
ncbi:MAG: hypothetical protein ACOYXB_03365 [Bacteroidota bacterium]